MVWRAILSFAGRCSVLEKLNILLINAKWEYFEANRSDINDPVNLILIEAPCKPIPAIDRNKKSHPLKTENELLAYVRNAKRMLVTWGYFDIDIFTNVLTWVDRFMKLTKNGSRLRLHYWKPTFLKVFKGSRQGIGENHFTTQNANHVINTVPPSKHYSVLLVTRYWKHLCRYVLQQLQKWNVAREPLLLRDISNSIVWCSIVLKK